MLFKYGQSSSGLRRFERMISPLDRHARTRLHPRPGPDFAWQQAVGLLHPPRPDCCARLPQRPRRRPRPPAASISQVGLLSMLTAAPACRRLQLATAYRRRSSQRTVDLQAGQGMTAPSRSSHNLQAWICVSEYLNSFPATRPPLHPLLRFISIQKPVNRFSR